eukprot:3539585-Pyramimonas_sp.AAC.1
MQQIGGGRVLAASSPWPQGPGARIATSRGKIIRALLTINRLKWVDRLLYASKSPYPSIHPLRR